MNARWFLLFTVILLAAAVQAQTSTVAPFVRGAVVRLDPKSGELLLKTPKGERTYWLTPRTYIFRGEEKLSADKLKPGDYLKLRVTSNTVVRIKVDTNTVPLPPLTMP
jgi:hypothetical protein